MIEGRHTVGSAALVERATGGDRAAFDALVAPHLMAALGAARLIAGDEADAADAVQEALLQSWRGLAGLRDPERFGPWFRQIVARAALRAVKRRRRLAEVALDALDRTGAPDGTLEHEFDRRRLSRAFERLGPKDRLVLTLHHYWDLPVAESSRILGIPEGTVRSRVHHALGRLRAAFDAEERR